MGRLSFLGTLLVLGVRLVGKGLEGLPEEETFCVSGPESCPMTRSGR
jgi:hypothetical protein